jgi:hypothetical protein
MRTVLVLTLGSLLACSGAAIPLSDSKAGPLPNISLSKTSGLVETVRGRYDHDDAVVVAPRRSRAVMLARPASCGEFKYWDGTACVDVRYMERHFK